VYERPWESKGEGGEGEVRRVISWASRDLGRAEGIVLRRFQPVTRAISA
jgi:hypothetical protein